MARETELTHPAPLWPHGPTSLMHLVRRASQRTTASWAATVTTGLSAVQYAILVVLAEMTTCDQQTLGARAGFDKATGTYLIDRMTQGGLIETHSDPENRRRKLVSMTKSGKAILDTMVQQAPAAETLFSDRLTADEIAQLNRLLSKLTDVAT
jgi:MarR family transcriptional regulator, lower aerobic nicotinate degradation pathway regulator